MSHVKTCIKSTKTLSQLLELEEKKTTKFFDDMDNFLNDKPEATGVANVINTSDTICLW